VESDGPRAERRVRARAEHDDDDDDLRTGGVEDRPQVARHAFALRFRDHVLTLRFAVDHLGHGVVVPGTGGRPRVTVTVTLPRVGGHLG